MEAYQQLEQEWGRINDRPHMVACNSGTAALHLALETVSLDNYSLNIVVPEYTMVACARAAAMAHCNIQFADCDDSLNVDLNKLEGQWADCSHPDVLMVVHVYGRRVDMDRVHRLAKRFNLLVIEDLAEAHGIQPHPDTHAACWSFYKNKIVHGEEGGAVAFLSERQANRARSLRSLGFTPSHDFNHIPRGMNYRMANCLAEKILPSIAQMGRNLASRRKVADDYRQALAEFEFPPADVDWVFPVRVPGISWEQQARIVRSLNIEEIEARCGFKPMSMQQEFYNPNAPMLNAYRIGQEVLYLPVFPGLSRSDVRYIADRFREAVDSVRKAP